MRDDWPDDDHDMPTATPYVHPLAVIEDAPESIFAREYVAHGDAKLATSRAGLQDARYRLGVLAERLLQKPEIIAAIAAERGKGAAGFRGPGDYSQGLLLDDFQRVHERAMEDGQYTAAISAKKLQAEMLGYLNKTMTINHQVSVQEMSDDQLLKIASGAMVTIEGEVMR